MRYISASIVVPVVGNFLKNGVVAIDESGIVKGIYENNDVAILDKEKELYDGVLIPAFVNAHCHIELSHMLDKTEKGVGLPRFLSAVMKRRAADEREILEKITFADELMWKNGIQAVGDHVNTSHSAEVKAHSRIRYHTFVEVMGLNKDELQPRIDSARDTEFYFDANHASITPHAPYSCSKELFKAFKRTVNEDNIFSVHNQESDEENKLFRYREGEFLDFYKEMGFDAEGFKAQARNSVQSYLPHLPKNNRLILVHNTFTSLKDIDFINRQDRDVYYCICPKANLYIEGKLPKILNFIPDKTKMILGTDSLASNDTLSILDEIKVLATHFDHLDFLQLLQWATINGAKALGLEDTIGSIELNKRPGLLLLKGMNNLRIHDRVTMQRIA
ncbi:amidohydrolase family protein [Sphingobacterium paludis]|uniref:Cytosine/adenosine deaminase-related metal-dependent hydrolase n=1 Tax=Sphingobacterium paludis TaxID=1476465 RepID=A0A4R7D0U8_9SPHI|nr:amidohydrolase family protein [Sphingobacterium paludis]TDS13937.1 cytosine/adenosine deaminase-related metal-dependent hydrolase [Sphingobacterium paludis]